MRRIERRACDARRTTPRTFGATLSRQKLDGVQFDFVFVARQHKQLAVTVFGACHFCVPGLGVEQDAICLATKRRQGVEDEKGVTERRAVGCIEAVCIVGPIGYALRRRLTC